mgnify:CR=1 FL=1
MLSLLLTIATFVRPLLHTNHHGTARRSCLVRAVSEPIYEVSDPLCPEDGERDGCGVPAEESVIAEYTPRLLKADETTAMLNDLQLNARTPLDTPPRGVFCTRSLDLKDIKCIGYDMDYTLIDYKMEVWEERAYHYSKEELQAKGFPVRGLQFNPELVCRGLIVDKENGNVLKVGRLPLTPQHPPLTTHHSHLTTHHSQRTTHHAPLTPHHSPLITHHSPLTTHHSPSPLATHPNPTVPKVDRFGYVRRAMHGTRMLSRSETFEQYGRDQADADLYLLHPLCTHYVPTMPTIPTTPTLPTLPTIPTIY